MTADFPEQASPVTRLSRRAMLSGGQPIGDLIDRALSTTGLISLAAGFVDEESLPVVGVQAALKSVWSEGTQAVQEALQYCPTAGNLGLRQSILAWLGNADGCNYSHYVSDDQVVVTAGSNQMLSLIGDTLLDPGDIVLCASPTYLVFLGTLHNLGAVSWGVATDQQGMVPESLDQTLADLQRDGQLGRVKAIYLVTDFDNPCGRCLPLSRRQQILEIVRRCQHRIFIIEDCAYRPLRFEGDDIPSLRSLDEDGQTVLITGTFSKSYSPGLRVGWGMLPTKLVDPIVQLKGNIDFGAPHFAQVLMAKVMETGLYDAHIAELRKTYCTKRDVMLAAFDSELSNLTDVNWEIPHGGLYVWVTLPESVDTGPTGTLFDIAIDERVLYVPGEYAYAQQGVPPVRNQLRLSYGLTSPAEIHQGIARLSRAIQRVIATG